MTTRKTIIGRIANSLLTFMSRRRLPQIEGNLTLQGVHSPVEILRDHWGIPHIYAQNQPDLFYAQGFVHAQDRLFQMELNRRTAAGRLSELFGELSLDTDRTIRTFGFNRLGKADLSNACDEIHTVMQAYAAGVNAFLEHPDTKLPVEFTLLNHKPEPWTPEDSMVFSRLMIWRLSHGLQPEIIRAELIEKVGPEHSAELEIHYPETNPVTLPNGIQFNALDSEGLLHKAQDPFLPRGQGSNGWVVNPARSETGHAVLCNDMHLNMSLPALWYEVHLNAPGYHCSGACLPGLPMVMVGHNERIAWGMTLAFTDVEDLFVEQFEGGDTPHYLFKGELLEAQVVEEPIRVKGYPDPLVEKIVITHHGAVISDVVGYPQQRVAVQSMALRPLPAIEGWYRLNMAAGWNDFVEAVRLIDAPQLNVVYADVEDNIGYWVTGKVPIRAKGDGRIPVPGWSGEFEWVGEVPFEEMPHALNPAEGFLINCNNKNEPEDFPYYLGNDYMNGYRAKRLQALITDHPVLTMQDHQDYQMDFGCVPGMEFVTSLEGHQDADLDVSLALKLLREWDGKLTADSIGGSVYRISRYIMVRNILEPVLGSEFTQRVMGVGFHPLLAGSNEFYGQDTVTLLRLLNDPTSWWIQNAGGRQNLINKSLKEAINWLRQYAGHDTLDWAWGRINQISFEHPMSLQKPFEQVFDRGPYPIGGDTDTPCQIAKHGIAVNMNSMVGPSFRQIVDMGDLTKSIAMYAPGQSGQLASPYYDNLIEPWLAGEYHPMLWTREQVDAEAKSRLLLNPG